MTDAGHDAPAFPVEIDLTFDAGVWPAHEELNVLVHESVTTTLAEVGAQVAGASELSIVFSDDAHVKELNAEWRGKAQPTNVLSFSAFPNTGPMRPGAVLPPLLGDIVLAAETVARETALEEKPLNHHITHLIVHGLLHLLGHDHETEEEAEEMEALERKILARLAIPDPYA